LEKLRLEKLSLGKTLFAMLKSYCFKIRQLSYAVFIVIIAPRFSKPYMDAPGESRQYSAHRRLFGLSFLFNNLTLILAFDAPHLPLKAVVLPCC
jgi:hypothetical protein